MENPAQHALALLRNQMTGDDLRRLSDVDLGRMESLCHHWQAMAQAEKKIRSKTVNHAFAEQRGRHGH